MKKGLITKSAYKKIVGGHPWLAANDIIDRSALPQRACAFQFADRWWLHSPDSYLRLRRFGPAQAGWMRTPRFDTLTNADQFHSYFGEWTLQHFRHLLEKKMALLDRRNEDLCLRWIFSENDDVPGLIVDVFGRQVVAQVNSAPIEVFWIQLKTYLEQAYHAVTGQNCEITTLRNSRVREKEGLEVISPESEPPPLLLRWNGFLWHMTPGGSQKTGAYFDQRENHLRTAELATKYTLRTAWDLCSYQGGFSLHLLKAGLNVTAIDQSSSALKWALENVRANNLSLEKFKVIEADVFSWLKEQKNAGAKADLIVLDPPSFVKSRREINSALRGYKELNTLALQCLNPGGLFVSCVCSHHITPKLYEKILKEAAALNKNKVVVLEQHGPSADHAPAPGFTEGHYLQAWYLQTMAPK